MYKKLDISYYLELQRRYEDILLMVSLHEVNFDAFSIKIENLFVDTCAFFDSLCQTHIVEHHNAGNTFSTETNISSLDNKLTGNTFFNINDYQTLFEAEYKLSSYKTNLNCYIDKYVGNPIFYIDRDVRTFDLYTIKPFENWQSTTNPKWWKDYTSLKHNRLENIKLGTLENLTHALAGTFIILSIKNEDTFKKAQLDKEIYNVFFPCYWVISGINTARGNIKFE